MKNKKIFKKKIFFGFFLIISFLSISNLSSNSVYEEALLFDGSVYPGSFLQKARACAMQIWTSSRKAVCSYQEQGRFEQELDLFLDTTLKLYSYILQFFESLEKMQSVNKSEIESLIRIIGDVERYFDIVMFGRKSDQASCIKVLLQKVQTKMEQMITSSAPF